MLYKYAQINYIFLIIFFVLSLLLALILFIASYLMAKQLCCSICDTFNPTDPGDLFSTFYSKVNPSIDKPIIVLMDEIDVLLKKIHNESLIKHKKVPIRVDDKCTWNSFCDIKSFL